MIPIVTPAEMGAIDAAAPEALDVLIDRAGAALAAQARRMLGGTYGRRVVVVAGRGNNGADGLAAAQRLRRLGVRVQVVDAVAGGTALAACDLVIDAAYGTGFRGTWQPPAVGSTPVLAADLPSGVDGLTGEASGPVLAATTTTTFAALKPGLLFPPGRELAGAVTVADIGLDVTGARCNLVEAADVARWLPCRPATAHKWRNAVWCIAGSVGMLGAAHLAARAAQRAGAGMVRLSSPGVDADPLAPTEAVGWALPGCGWDDGLEAELARFHALVVGPGLSRAEPSAEAVRRVVTTAPCPVLVDGDGLAALGTGPAAAAVVAGRRAPTVVTPHDGEYERLRGAPVGPDRIEAARRLAADLGVVVLLKGPATVVAEPDGGVRVVGEGDARLATAGTGDVLAGIIGALLAQGLGAAEAAAAGAYVHARAAALAAPVGLVAGDLPALVPAALRELGELSGRP